MRFPRLLVEAVCGRAGLNHLRQVPQPVPPTLPLPAVALEGPARGSAAFPAQPESLRALAVRMCVCFGLTALEKHRFLKGLCGSMANWSQVYRGSVETPDEGGETELPREQPSLGLVRPSRVRRKG